MICMKNMLHVYGMYENMLHARNNRISSFGLFYKAILTEEETKRGKSQVN